MNNLITGLVVALLAIIFVLKAQRDVPTIFMVGDSTVMDYEDYYENYQEKAFPLTGWGQSFKAYMNKDSLALLTGLLHGDTAVLENRAIGGRSTRSFFQEGRWRRIYDELQVGDIVLIQMGHNDATPAEIRPHRAVTPTAYQEFLRLYVSQTREQGATPILITPVNQNKWEDGEIQNSHGAYYRAMVALGQEMDCTVIDLTVASMQKFQESGPDYVSAHYFMNLPAGKYSSNPDGLKDNTHLQTEGGQVVAQLVFDALKGIAANGTK